MARIRQVKPDFFRSEDVARLEMTARVLFIGLWTLADREGRLLDRPRRIAVEIFPYDSLHDRIDGLLTVLHNHGLIYRYKADGLACIQITGFAKHQKPHPKEPPSELPLPTIECEFALEDDVGQNRGETGPNNDEPGLATDEDPARNVLPLPSSVVLGSGSMGSGVGGEISASLRSAPPPVRSTGNPIGELAFQTDGKIRSWWVTQEQLAEWEAIYPSLDVLAECRKALAWTKANPTKRKTANGMPAFLVNWLNRAQNTNGTRGSPGPPLRKIVPRTPGEQAELDRWKKVREGEDAWAASHSKT